MRKRLFVKGADLEELIGGKYEFQLVNGEWKCDSYFNDEILWKNLQVLRLREVRVDFENHFSMFNAISLIPGFKTSKATLDRVDSALADYILTCRKDCEKAAPNHMLCDLIVEHWPVQRSMALTRLILEDCRYVFRIRQLLANVGFLSSDLRPEYKAGLRALCREYSKSKSLRKRRLASFISQILDERRRYIRDAEFRGITKM